MAIRFDALKASLQALPKKPENYQQLESMLAAKPELRAALKQVSPAQAKELNQVLGFAGAAQIPTGVRSGSSAPQIKMPALPPEGGPTAVLGTPKVYDLTDPAAKSAIATAQSYVKTLQRQTAKPGGAQAVFTPGAVFRDELGMTHVRLWMQAGKIPVYGRQVIVHLKPSGKVRNLTGDFACPVKPDDKTPPKLSPKQALAAAKAAYAKQYGVDDKMQVVSGPDLFYEQVGGQYHKVYRIGLAGTDSKSGKQNPVLSNFMVDVNTGKLVKSWDKLDLEPLVDQATLDEAAANPPPTLTGGRTFNPPKKILDRHQRSSTIHLLGADTKAKVRKATVTLDLKHPSPGDLTIRLRSPSGKSVQIQKHMLNRNTAVAGKTTIDVTDLFKGEPAVGKWHMTVYDYETGDQGTWSGWNLNVQTGASAKPSDTPVSTDVANDHSDYYGIVDLKTTKDSKGYTLYRPDGMVETRDAENKSPYAVQSDFNASVPMHDANDAWGEVGETRDLAAVDAQFGAGLILKFLKQILDRNSIDGKGMPIKQMVHVGNNYVNAFWANGVMHFGDGDGKLSAVLTPPDVHEHELAHGICEHTAGFIYSGESGGLNEANSDIIGTAFKWYVSKRFPKLQKFNWKIGDRCWTPDKPGDALRYMNDPTKDGRSIDNYKNYKSSLDVHLSSGIANNFFALFVSGGTNRTSGMKVEGLTKALGGLDKAMVAGIKVWYRYLTVYGRPSDKFADARAGCIQAAKDLYPNDPEILAQVKSAWSAVGVTGKASVANRAMV